MLKRLLLGLALLTTPLHAATLGDDGLHDAPWIHETFKDLREDHETALAEGKTLLVMIEQRGCIYCTKMHEEVFPQPEITAALTDDFYVVQINMFGDVEVTDFDGTSLPEKDMVRRWNAQFTPTLMFFPPDVSDDAIASQVTIVTMPGAFGKSTTLNLLNWISEGHYLGDEPFQKYHARMLEENGIVE